jgi:hypothetical protein
MAEENFETGSLEDLAERIVECANEADEKTIEAAQLVREARRRVDDGEAGDTTWTDWAKANTGLSATRLWELQRIADAENPRLELERLREDARKRAKKHRQKKEAEMATPLQNRGQKTTKVPTEPDLGQQSQIGSRSEDSESHFEERTDVPPLRNGGEDAATKSASEEQEVRDRLANWAVAAPIEQVRRVLSYIESLEQAESGSDPEDLVAPAAA